MVWAFCLSGNGKGFTNCYIAGKLKVFKIIVMRMFYSTERVFPGLRD